MEQIVLCGVSMILGVLIGAVDTVFGRGLIWISSFRSEHVVFLLPFLAPAGLAIVFVYQKWGGESAKGMSLVFSVGHGEKDTIPLRLVPLIIATTWMTHLFGGSAGREGVAVQLGACVSHNLAKKLPVKNAEQVLLTVGMAAGFAGLFRTPLAAVFFALEVLSAGEIRYRALIPSLIGAFTAAKTSELLGLEKFEVILPAIENHNFLFWCGVIAAGALFGLTGLLFSSLLSMGKKTFAKRMPDPYKRIVLVSVGLSVVLFVLFKGRYCGLGTNLISDALQGGSIYSFDWLLKLLLTVITLSAGFQGGEVTPLFSIGASLGYLLAGLTGGPVQLFAALGYIAVFAGATNTLFGPMLIGLEVFGSANMPCYVVVCAVAFAVNRNRSIYAGQKIQEKV